MPIPDEKAGTKEKVVDFIEILAPKIIEACNKALARQITIDEWEKEIEKNLEENKNGKQQKD